jgi:ankyrin repeat protein
MEKDNYDNKILNLIKNKEYNEFFELIKNNKTINLDMIDNNYNYENSNINITTKNQENIYEICFKYKRNDMLIFLLQEEYSKSNSLDIYNLKGESIIQLALTYENNIVLKFLMNLELSKEIINNKENEYGLNALQQSIIINNNIISNELLKKNININLTDSIGNSSLHYSLYESNFDILNKLLEYDYLNYNISNSNGNIPLHICFDTININNTDGKYNYIDFFTKIFKNSNINYLNNEGNTPIHLLVDYEYWKNKEIENILRSGDVVINIFIKNNDNNTPLDLVNNNADKEKFIDIVIDSYYNNLKKNKNLLEEWEKYCAVDDLDNLLKSIKKKPGKEIKIYCKDQIKKLIDNNIRSIPKIEDIDLQIDEGIYMTGCYYTGSTLDILYGLVYLHSLNKNIGFILEYPLVDNNKLLDYYKQLGINENYKLEFSNIEIIWVYQKIIFPTNFDSILKNKMNNNNDFIVIPLGIDTPVGSHANMITFMRVKHKKINQKDLALELIRIIKFKNIKFKNLIRNFSNKVTILRDEELKKHNLNIDDWMLKKYDENIINKIEENVLNTII